MNCDMSLLALSGSGEGVADGDGVIADSAWGSSPLGMRGCVLLSRVGARSKARGFPFRPGDNYR